MNEKIHNIGNEAIEMMVLCRGWEGCTDQLGASAGAALGEPQGGILSHILGGTTCSTLLDQWRFIRVSTFFFVSRVIIETIISSIKAISCRRAH